MSYKLTVFSFFELEHIDVIYGFKVYICTFFSLSFSSDVEVLQKFYMVKRLH